MAVQEMTEARMSITPALPQSRPEIEPDPLSTAPGARVLLPLALTTGGLLWMCHFPVACGWLAWVALVPLFTLIRSRARARTVYLSAFAGGLLFYWSALQWMRVADPMMYYSWGFVATYCAVYFPVTILLLRFLERRTALPLPVTLPIAWTALEFFRSYFGTGFSWYLISHTQHDWLPIIQISDITGAYGVSFLLVAWNAVLLEVCWGFAGFRRLLGREDDAPRWSRRAVIVQAFIVLLMLIGTFSYGVVRMQQAAFTPGPRIALVQGNLPQQVRNQATGGGLSAARQMYQHYSCLSHPALVYRPDLIVWPETSHPADYYAVAEGVDRTRLPAGWGGNLAETRELLQETHYYWPTNVLLGLNSRILSADGSIRRYNSALLIDAAGQAAGRYDKIHRVPLGEYIPLRDELPFMNRFSPYDFDYGVAAGSEYTQFPLARRNEPARCSFGVAICYEDTLPDLTRPYGGGGSHQTDFILNISNDGWFDGTSEHEEHLAISRFRAVESRRSVARAVNMGVSAVIDGNGRVLRPQEISLSRFGAMILEGRPYLQAIPAQMTSMYAQPNLASGIAQFLRLQQLADASAPRIVAGSHIWCIPSDPAEQQALPTGEWKDYKKVSGLLFASIPLDTRSSFYARHGDWLPWSCWGLLAAALLFALFRSPLAA